MSNDATQPKHGDLRVWWIPQLSGKEFCVPVKSAEDAAMILAVLEKYDLFQFENKIKPDYANTGGLEVYDTEWSVGEWADWTDEDGLSIEEWMEARAK